MGDWLALLGVLAAVAGAFYAGWARAQRRTADPFLAYLQHRVTELERQVDGMHQRGLVSPQAPAPPEPAPPPLPYEVDRAIDGFEDPEVQALLRQQAADYFAQVPTADPGQYVADLLRDR